MTVKTFPTGYAHGTITLTASIYGDDGSSNVFYTVADIVSQGVASFNNRTGTVTLSASDVTTAGGVAAANPSISGTLTHATAGAVRIVGASATAGTVTDKVRTSGFSNDYDVEWQYSGGSNGSVGQGTVNVVCGTFEINGVSIAASNNPNPRIVTASGPVQIVSTDGLVIINKSASETTTVTLEASPATNRVPVRIADGKGDASVNNITVVPASGTIDGTSTAVINQDRGTLTIEYAGGNWYIT